MRIRALSATSFALGVLLFLPLAAHAYVTPGTTLDPGCAPSDPACAVATSTIAAGTAGQVAYYSVNGQALSGIALSSLNVSSFNNDAGYVNAAGARSALSGQNISMFNNDANYITASVSSLTSLGTISSSLSGVLSATAGALSAGLVNLASQVSGILPVGNGGTGVSAIAAGAIPFGNGSGAIATSTALFFDSTNGRLGIGTTSPTAPLEIYGSNSSTNLATGGGVFAALTNADQTDGNFDSISYREINSAGAEVTGTRISGVFNSHTAGTESADLALLTRNNGSLSEKVRITGAGTVGVGSSTPFAKLSVQANSTDTNAYLFAIGSSTASATTTLFAVSNSGVATFSGPGGTCVIDGSGNCTSDQRLKTNIAPISGTDALAKLSLIQGVTYNWLDPSLTQSQQVGVIAQNVLKAFPQLVGTVQTSLDGVAGTYYTVNYAGLVAPLISAVNSFAQSITTAVLNATTIHTDTLCVGTTCVNQSQLQQLLQANGVSAIQQDVIAPSVDSGAGDSVATSTDNSDSSQSAATTTPTDDSTVSATDSSTASQTDDSATTTPE